ncbi:penicillin-binding protein 2 [Helicobacter anatolicus]|uniref:penicillin-binding protein 2 n=1 Tax=Helicobacter anatolicus TaxID=2905874 RepID=UPI001E617141|nr:penicillin-binding protein 2 [Helicobacter anatolicus]MCE3037754.1 penicillin-binding protein 2 [Helicobacter anatolicus]
MNFRIKLIAIFFIAIWIVLLVRIFAISIQSNQYYMQLAQKNITRKDIDIPFRGLIKDRNGSLVAINKLGFSIALDPHLNQKQLDAQIDFLLQYLPHLNAQDILKSYDREKSPYNHTPIKVVKFVDYDLMQKKYAYLIQNNKIFVEPASRRFYPYKTSASHVIGYVGASDEKDIIKNVVSKYTGVVGKTGLERQYNVFLQGQISEKIITVDSHNRIVSVRYEKDSVNRNDLTISLDMRLQKIADEAFDGKNGAVLVMDIENGELLVAGSYPEYDLNDFVGGVSYAKWNALQEDLSNPLLNKLVNGLYAPGSVIKMGMALALLEYAGINEHTLVDTPGFIELGGRRFRDWKPGGHGKTDVVKALRESVDVYFYKLSQQAGMTNLAGVLGEMGFGAKTGVDLPNEFVGILPSPEWKMSKGQQWYLGDTVVTSIGQGSFLVTPMQIVRYTGLMASGELSTPHFAKIFQEKESDFKNKDILNDFQKSKLKFIQEGMYQACSSQGGTARRATKSSLVPLACKTGTTQVISIPQNIKVRIKESDLPYYHRSHAWITGYAPYKNPKYAITVFIEHGESGGKAGPILARMANALKEYGYIK